MNNSIIQVESFPDFYRGWFSRQQDFLDELIRSLLDENDEFIQVENLDESDRTRINDLISRIGFHYFQYFQAKATLIQRDVYSVIYQAWLTSYERILLWIGGFKPATVFRIVSAVGNAINLTPDQERRMSALEEEIKAEETWLTREFDRIQRGAIFAPQITAVLTRRTRDQTAMNTLQSTVQTLVEGADALRMKAATKVTEILDQVQTLKFFAGMARVQVRRREIGLQEEENSGRQRNNQRDNLGFV